MDNVKILALVGMSGSGKSVAVDYLTDQGYPKVYFGGMIYKEMEKRGIPRSDDGETEKKFREEIRETEGKDWVVRQVIAETKDLYSQHGSDPDLQSYEDQNAASQDRGS